MAGGNLPAWRPWQGSQSVSCEGAIPEIVMPANGDNGQKSPEGLSKQSSTKGKEEEESMASWRKMKLIIVKPKKQHLSFYPGAKKAIAVFPHLP